MAKKPVKPVIKSEEKPKPVAAAAKPKAAADDGDEVTEKKVKSALELLPPSPFDLFNFKTFYVNCPDKKGVGFDEFMRQVDKEGYAFWFLHYEKVGKEGQVGYMFQNLLEGFIQILEDFRKYSFGKFFMLGDEPNLELMGVMLVRGQGIPQELIDHP